MRGFKELKGSTTKCADQNCDFVDKLNKTQFCGRSPCTGGEPHYIWCCGSCVISAMFFYALISIDISDK